MFTILNILTAVYIISKNESKESIIDTCLYIWAYVALVVSCWVVFELFISL